MLNCFVNFVNKSRDLPVLLLSIRIGIAGCPELSHGFHGNVLVGHYRTNQLNSENVKSENVMTRFVERSQSYEQNKFPIPTKSKKEG